MCYNFPVVAVVRYRRGNWLAVKKITGKQEEIF